MNTNFEYYKTNLINNGYTIIPNILNQEEINEYKKDFFYWFNNTPNLKEHHNIIHSNGIIKYYDIGHQKFVWKIRINKNIQNIFKYLWDTDELIVSFDGCCYYTKDYNKNDTYWTHTDQSPNKKGLHCYQSFVSLTDNTEKTIILYEKSHLLHEHYFKTIGITGNNDWQIIDKSYLDNFSDTFKKLKVNKGDLVIWDSRTFHQNVSGNKEIEEERLVQYLCYCPREKIDNNFEEQKKRHLFFENYRTTNHWPNNLSAVPMQPITYNYINHNNPIFIDYNEIDEPILDDIIDEINKLL